MVRRVGIITLAALCPLLALARSVRTFDTKTLAAKSELVFVGRVNSIQPSGITTTMSYPDWRGATFEWLKVEVEVLEPVKGVQRGQMVSTVMLSADRQLVNKPGMIEPTRGTAYLLCLLPTTISNVFAAFTAPWDEDRSIFILDRERSRYAWYFSNDTNAQDKVWNNERGLAALLWTLVDDNRQICASGAEQMRKAFHTEINTAPPTNAVIHLQWETWKSPSGWQWDVPKGSVNVTNSPESAEGPVAMPVDDRQ